MNALILLSMLAGQCGPGGCSSGYMPNYAPVYVQPAQRPTQPDPSENVYTWKATGIANQIALFRDGKQIGVWNYTHNRFCRVDAANNWEWADTCPATPPPQPDAPTGTLIGQAQLVPNYGLDLDKIQRSRSYNVSGKPATKDEATAALELKDDSGKHFVTFVGPSVKVNPIKALFATSAELKALAESWHVVFYRTDVDIEAAMAKSGGYKLDGEPSIYFHAPGKVFHRQDEWQGVGQLVETARKANPNYKPENDPNVNNPLDAMKQMPGWVWIAGIIALLFVVQKKPTPDPKV